MAKIHTIEMRSCLQGFSNDIDKLFLRITTSLEVFESLKAVDCFPEFLDAINCPDSQKIEPDRYGKQALLLESYCWGITYSNLRVQELPNRYYQITRDDKVDSNGMFCRADVIASLLSHGWQLVTTTSISSRPHGDVPLVVDTFVKPKPYSTVQPLLCE